MVGIVTFAFFCIVFSYLGCCLRGLGPAYLLPSYFPLHSNSPFVILIFLLFSLFSQFHTACIVFLPLIWSEIRWWSPTDLLATRRIRRQLFFIAFSASAIFFAVVGLAVMAVSDGKGVLAMIDGLGLVKGLGLGRNVTAGGWEWESWVSDVGRKLTSALLKSS